MWSNECAMFHSIGNWGSNNHRFPLKRNLLRSPLSSAAHALPNQIEKKEESHVKT